MQALLLLALLCSFFLTLLAMLHYSVLLHIRKDYRTISLLLLIKLFVSLFVLFFCLVSSTMYYLMITFNI